MSVNINYLATLKETTKAHYDQNLPEGCSPWHSDESLDCDIVVSEFEFQSRYDIHFWTNILRKVINTLISITKVMS